MLVVAPDCWAKTRPAKKFGVAACLSQAATPEDVNVTRLHEPTKRPIEA
jgi:hypothetical protein